jgi:hypothetical protein
MITQEFKNGKSTIKIENAISLEDAKKNNFHDGVFSRIFIDGKPSEYMGMVNHIIANSKENGRFIPPDKESLKQLQRDLIKKQKEEFKEMIDKVKTAYGTAGASEDAIRKLDDIADKVDLSFVRVEP